jgi:hypothetical protein
MDRRRIFRCLRISFSAFCLIVCALLIAMWVRSYSHIEGFVGVVRNYRIVAGAQNTAIHVSVKKGNWFLTLPRSMHQCELENRC